ncbi:MAG TPA: hypothetical protein VHM26_10355 [Chitinophagaceae bacterium]|jgi:antitoxin component YwqK of YwqJK toxin-antitoxin module|nr:hypothetical protein [Chitinophagaceae bacterium]
MRIVLLLIATCCCKSLFSQADTMTFYFHENLNVCPKENASLIGYAVKSNNLVALRMYALKDNRPFLTGYYTDTTFTIKEGRFIYYGSRGYKEFEGVFRNNERHGAWAHYQEFTDSRVVDSTYYDINGNYYARTLFEYYKNGMLIGRLHVNEINKTKEHTTWHQEGQLASKATWIDNNGTRTFYYPNGKMSSVETYKKGRITSTKYYDNEEKQAEKFLMEEQMDQAKVIIKDRIERQAPEFIGGDTAFKRYINERFSLTDIRTAAPDLSTLTFCCYLNKDGKAYNVSVLETLDKDLQAKADTFMASLPAWNMKGHKQWGPFIYTIELKK